MHTPSRRILVLKYFSTRKIVSGVLEAGIMSVGEIRANIDNQACEVLQTLDATTTSLNYQCELLHQGIESVRQQIALDVERCRQQVFVSKAALRETLDEYRDFLQYSKKIKRLHHTHHVLSNEYKTVISRKVDQLTSLSVDFAAGDINNDILWALVGRIRNRPLHYVSEETIPCSDVSLYSRCVAPSTIPNEEDDRGAHFKHLQSSGVNLRQETAARIDINTVTRAPQDTRQNNDQTDGSSSVSMSCSGHRHDVTYRHDVTSSSLWDERLNDESVIYKDVCPFRTRDVEFRRDIADTSQLVHSMEELGAVGYDVDAVGYDVDALTVVGEQYDKVSLLHVGGGVCESSDDVMERPSSSKRTWQKAAFPSIRKIKTTNWPSKRARNPTTAMCFNATDHR